MPFYGYGTCATNRWIMSAFSFAIYGHDSHLTCERCGFRRIHNPWPHPPYSSSVPPLAFLYSFLLSLVILSSFHYHHNLFSLWELFRFCFSKPSPSASLSFLSLTHTHNLSMADQFSLCLLTVMDHLWFHHTILFPEPTSLILSKTLKPASLNLSLHEVEGTPSPLEEEEEESRDSSPMSAQLVYNRTITVS